jgi:hypothetical protein
MRDVVRISAADEIFGNDNGKAGRIREGDRAACDRSARLHGVEVGEQPHPEFNAVVGVAEFTLLGQQ